MIDLEAMNETIDALEGLEDADHDLNVGLIRNQMIALIAEVERLQNVVDQGMAINTLLATQIDETTKEVERLQGELAKFHECADCDVAGHLDPIFREHLAKIYHREGE